MVQDINLFSTNLNTDLYKVSYGTELKMSFNPELNKQFHKKILKALSKDWDNFGN